jgi:hypothetical protein
MFLEKTASQSIEHRLKFKSIRDGTMQTHNTDIPLTPQIAWIRASDSPVENRQ